MKKSYERIKKLIALRLSKLREEDVVAINNRIAGWDGSLDYVEENGEEFLKCFFGNKPDELARAITYGDYNYAHPYVKFNEYANIVTCCYPVSEGWIDIDDIVDWLIDSYNNKEERESIIEDYGLLERG